MRSLSGGPEQFRVWGLGFWVAFAIPQVNCSREASGIIPKPASRREGFLVMLFCSVSCVEMMLKSLSFKATLRWTFMTV